MIRKGKLLLVFAVVTALLLTQAMPAFAISVINNSFSANDYTIDTNQTVYFTAKTNFGWSVMPNPYSSNFVTEVNAYHFNRLVTTATNVSASESWGYHNPGIFTSPAYRYYSGWMWIFPTLDSYCYSKAVAKSATSGTRRGHRHGQSTELNWDISYGSPAWIYTTHN